MLQIHINNKTLLFEPKQGTITIDGNVVNADVAKIDKDKYHVILNNASYTIELLEKDDTGKNLKIMVNGKKQIVGIKDKYDELLKQLGMDKMMGKKSNTIKSPMPGLVLRVLVSEGDLVKKGDALLVLEAMKMENIIKADADAIVKKVNVNVKQPVEKNAVLIELE
ncbi:MAG: biotin/lipoyl-containing protein [Bacteroidia bacterium]